ncbi:MAG: thioesterase family protein, partial [Chloroflexota bacterium]
MSLIYERTFRVRHYECDVYGHVNNTNYLRYMQEAAFDASAAAGYDLGRYEALSRRWFIRETDIEYLRPLRYGNSVRVKTWVADFRRVRSRRMYELWHVDSNELAARAGTDWVYINSTTGQPATIPPDMVAAFGLSPEAGAAPREKFPPAPPPPPGVFRTRRQVQWREIDSAGHVNNAIYMDYVSDCGMEIAATYGWPVARMQAAGFGIVVRRHQIEYRESAVEGDELEVATWVSALKRATGIRHYTISRVRDGALLVQVHSLCVWVNLATGQPVRVPSEDFGRMLSGDP